MDWEFYVLNYIQKNLRTDFLDKLMPMISMLGTMGALWVTMAVVSLCIKKHRDLGISLIYGIITDLVLCNGILKLIVGRIRPYDLNKTITLFVKPEIDTSFPSGHTFFAFTAATICFLYNKKLGIAAYLVAFMIAVSRLYLYVHFPTDVMMGAVFGTISGIIAWKLKELILSKDESAGIKTMADGVSEVSE